MEGQSSDPGDLRWKMGLQEPLCFEHALYTLRQYCPGVRLPFPTWTFFFFFFKQIIFLIVPEDKSLRSSHE